VDSACLRRGSGTASQARLLLMSVSSIEQMTDWTRVVLHHTKNACQSLPKGRCSTYCSQPKKRPRIDQQPNAKPTEQSKSKPIALAPSSKRPARDHNVALDDACLEPPEGNNSRDGKPVRVDPGRPVRELLPVVQGPARRGDGL
jgi:hypothetical protein